MSARTKAALDAAVVQLDNATEEIRAVDNRKHTDAELWGAVERRRAMWLVYADAYEAHLGKYPRDCFGMSAV